MIKRIRRNPRFRALRADKLIYAALEATLQEYLLERHDRIPVLRMVELSAADMKVRSENFARSFDAKSEVLGGESLLGGGSTPAHAIPTWVISLSTEQAVEEVAARLRAGTPAVVARIEHDRLILDLRSVSPDQEQALSEALSSALSR